MRVNFGSIVPVLVLAVTTSALAQSSNDEDVVYLRDATPGCGPLQVLDPDVQCFTNVTALVNWLKTGRVPHISASSPVHVDIGPGTYAPLSIACDSNDTGYVAFRGAGRESTRFKSTSIFSAGISVTGCEGLHFQDLAGEGLGLGIAWSGKGDGNFESVDALAGQGFATSWAFQATCSGSNAPRTTWFSSRLIQTPLAGSANRAMTLLCGTHRFHNSEIRVLATAATPSGTAIQAIFASGSNTSVEIFGGIVRALVPAGTNVSVPTVTGLSIGGPAVAAVHGGLINVTAEGSTATPSNAIAIEALDSGGSSARVNATGTAYTVLKGSGSGSKAVRLKKTGNSKIEAPFLWPADATAPAVDSLDGQDLFVETDCNLGTNDCTTGSEAHLMIYNPLFCPTQIWLNAMTGNCRSGD